MNADRHESEKKFRQFIKKIVALPKSEIDRREKEYKKMRAEKKRLKL
jgi:hypothetical protein